MPTPKQIAAMQLYSELMEEIKVRIEAIDTGTRGSMKFFPPAIVREFCFQQLRMICEVIALGCLVAHGDITEATSLRKLSSAGQIMEELGKLHPEFFPKPVHQSWDQGGIMTLETITDRLSKQGLLDLYGECNRYAHRGSLRNLLRSRFPIQLDFPEITTRVQKIHDLLAMHVLFTLGDELMFFCMLRNNDMKVSTMITGIAGLQPPPTM